MIVLMAVNGIFLFLMSPTKNTASTTFTNIVTTDWRKLAPNTSHANIKSLFSWYSFLMTIHTISANTHATNVTPRMNVIICLINLFLLSYYNLFRKTSFVMSAREG